MRSGRRLLGLVAVVVTVGVLSVPLAAVSIQTPVGLDRLPLVLHFALTFCQASLLGLWVVLSGSSPWKRLTGLAIGTAYLETAFNLATESEFTFMPSVAMALTVLGLFLVRGSGRRLARSADKGDSPGPEGRGFRFSIRGLMAVTALVAVLSALARAVQESGPRVGMIDILLWSVCIVAVGLLCLRALSGSDRPLRRGMPAVAVSPLLGAFFACAVNAHSDGWVYIILIMLLYPATLLGSLLVVRASGFRLVRRAPPSAEVAEAPP